MEFYVGNVNEALSRALENIKLSHSVEQSRNGDVWVFPEPVMTIYNRPTERVLFSPLRDANPFFHLMESLWMLAGRNDIAWPAYFAANMANYSDDKKTLHGAYGYRWRKGFSVDQLRVLAEHLRKDPSSRRAVLTMWAPEVDLVYATDPSNKDAPCNTHCYLDARNGALNLTVCCRSNDLWWGAYGANAVHFSILQEFMAAFVGIPVGEYRQFSNNLHLYTSVVAVNRIDEYCADIEAHDHYLSEDSEHYPLVQGDPEMWLPELDRFLRDPLNNKRTSYLEPFFPDVAIPMYRAWWLHKEGHAPREVTLGARDWEIACNAWLARRHKK
jgi:Thymidylate synthase